MMSNSQSFNLGGSETKRNSGLPLDSSNNPSAPTPSPYSPSIPEGMGEGRRSSAVNGPDLLESPSQLIPAAPSMSAEEQWIESVVKPSQAANGGDPHSIHLLSSPNPNQSHLQTPSQLEAQRRMELMQREVDEVIGVMRMNFEDKCVVSPDRRLSELYHHCPEYASKWKCGGKGDQEAEESRKRRIRFWKQMGVLFGVVLLISSFFILDFLLSNWFIQSESEKELLEAILRRGERGNGTTTEKASLIDTAQQDVGGGVGRSLLEAREVTTSNHGNVEATTITLFEEIEEEDIKTTIEEEPAEQVDESDTSTQGGRGDRNGMLAETFPRGHDVLDPAEVINDAIVQNEDGVQLVASND